MGKRIEVTLVDPGFDEMTDVRGYVRGYPKLYSTDCPNILKQFEDKEISKDDVTKAIDMLTAYFYKEEMYKMVLDIDERDRYLSPAKEMTIDEIELALGHKVKIVSGTNEKEEVEGLCCNKCKFSSGCATHEPCVSCRIFSNFVKKEEK